MTTPTPDLSHFWMPFTANRRFKDAPRLFESAKGMYYTTVDGREVLDATAGLWCVNAGHCREEIVQAVTEQMSKMDFAPTFQMGHPLAFEAASKVAELMPGPNFLHQLGLGVGRYRIENGVGLSPGAGRGPAYALYRSRTRLSRRWFRRHFGRRYFTKSQGILGQPDTWRRSLTAYAESRRSRIHPGPAGLGCAPGR